MKWGIIGYGEIAPSFVESLKCCSYQELYAIASRSKHHVLKNDSDILNHGIVIYSNYEQLYNDKNIDIVYIATTNNLHKENVLNCLNAGKHVLSEKPIGVCKKDVVEMINASRQHNKFLMEGMWTRFLPAYKEFIKQIRSGAVGEIKFVQADFGFLSTWGEERRLLSKELFGGVILDNTDYNIFLCQDIFQEPPKEICATGNFAKTGVEDRCSIVFKYNCGAIAQLYSSFVQKTNQDAIVYGTEGSIRFREFWHGTEIELTRNGRVPQTIKLPFSSTGLVHEIDEVVECIKKRKIESEVIPHLLSMEIAGIMDEVIKQVKK